MVYEERFGDRVTCPHCECKGASFEDIQVAAAGYEETPWQESICPRCHKQVWYKRVSEFADVSSLWLADASGEPIRRYVIQPQAESRRVRWHMFVEDPLHTFLARVGYYDRFLQRVYTGKQRFARSAGETLQTFGRR